MNGNNVRSQSYAGSNCSARIERVELKTLQSFLRNQFLLRMGLEENAAEILDKKDHACQSSTLCMHAFYDLTHVSPVVFLYLLKECYFYGTCKATAKFRALQHQVYLVLQNDPKPGPATFVVQCLYISPLFEDHSRGFSHLVISALSRFLKVETTLEDSSELKDLAANLFIDIVRGQVYHDKNIVVKILEVFDVKLTNIEKALCQLKEKNDPSFGTAEEFIKQYIFELVESQMYMKAVTLMEHFSIRQSGQSFLLSMIENNQFKAAEKWALFMGKPMLCTLIEKYIQRNMLKDAYETIKKNNLQQEFPDLYQSFEESSLKKLAEKGCWDVAEAKANNDRQLIEHLVYLAMEAGYMEKVDELCDRYSLDGFSDIKVPETSLQRGRYLHLDELFIEDVIWVDEAEGLLDATSHIEKCKLIGVDCEWKPNYVKGSKPNKVSIMQIASEKTVFILDLIKLHGEEPDILDDCLARILQSPRILKLGYNFVCDIKQLAHSYEELSCFKHYEKLLDIQNIFKESRGGLSGLAEKILGAGLNKTRRNSNWEQRPLTQHQLEYAALDAVVLVHIFCHLRCQSQPLGDKFEWKSCIETHNESVKRSDNYTTS